MITKPIVPPRMSPTSTSPAATTRKGLTLEAAENTLCGGNAIATDDTSTTVGWGIAPNFRRAGRR